jgi:hypothetical protein
MIVVFKASALPLDIVPGRGRSGPARRPMAAIEKCLPVFDMMYNNYRL